MGARQILITGGDGYLGQRLARRYLEEDRDAVVVLWMRASDAQACGAKREALVPILGAFGERVRYDWGDLGSERPFERLDPSAVGRIIHAAAVTRFNVDAETARRVNVEGTDKLLRFASECSALDGVGLLSTVYASGLATGRIDEALMDGAAGFANHYERSKWEAEMIAAHRYAQLPWRIVRVATVIADDEGGAVTQYNAVHNTLKLLYYGLISVLPGHPRTPLYLVTGAFAAEAIHAVMAHGASRAVYHAAHTQQESLRLGELIDLAFETFARSEDFLKRRVLKPLYADEPAFALLAKSVQAFGGGPVNQAVSSVTPFAKQLFVSKEIRNERLAATLGAYRAPDPQMLVRNTCAYLARTKWGREVPHAVV